MSWPIGTIVVCVDDAAPQWHNSVTGEGFPEAVIGRSLVMGGYYTVRESLTYTFTVGKRDAVRLQENVRMGPTMADVPWCASRFRLAEGGACESERAHSLKANKASK